MLFLISKDNKGLCAVKNIRNNITVSEEKRSLKEYPIFVRDNYAVHIIRKIFEMTKESLENYVCSRNVFNLPSTIRGHSIKTENDLLMFSSAGESFIDKKFVNDKMNILDKYKVIITYAMSGGNKPGSDGKYQIISSLKILNPNTVCTETYLVLSSFDKYSEAENMCSYVKTKFFRFLLLQALSSIHITKSTFTFVPLQDFSHPWTDEMLYKKYSLTSDEISFIEKMIRPME